MAHQQRSLQRQADVFGNLAGSITDRVKIAQLRTQPFDVAVQPGVLACAAGQLVKQHLDACGPGCHGAQGI
ncbi:Uncharacterised protein [Mycobacterium tuberculosis]|nr:Uncharacterised protein [Mycobacterium tuberculosis]